MERFTKQLSESFTITGDFSENMSDAETLEDIVAIARDKDGNDATNDILDLATLVVVNQGIDVMVQGGTVALEPYVITFMCTTSHPHDWEIDVKMRVKDN